ncbi:hypothetical protein GXW78_04075 [Roseomonas terrae]|jgi:hypothetical protein|uniref:Lipocalin-like domain-containing protein n=1 Tax=Neoroseomonas terrae TaxID=424799 RepID=A0ABS5ECT6_9PROT|nr:hypothetical protein [Neoroseomonas terrae]MBR0648825.1 hypothetical protein [Neoroseomonas terrae]
MTAALLTALAIALVPIPAPPAQRLLVQATTAFDGTWSGTGTLTGRRGRGTACSAEDTNRRFTIQNGQISFPYDTRHGISFSGPIQADGSFDLVNGQNRFQGRATGSELTATFTGAECIRSFQMRRRRN